MSGDLSSRSWYGELEDHPVITGPDSIAKTLVAIDPETVREYVGVESSPVADVAVGSIASATCSHAGYRVVEVLDIADRYENDEFDAIVVEVLVTGSGST